VHDEVRCRGANAAGLAFCSAAGQHAGDIRVIHQGQRPALGLEAGDDLLRVHARLDEPERNHALDRLGLLGHPHGAHTAFADMLDQLVRADDGSWDFGSRQCDGRHRTACFRPILQKPARFLVRPQQALDSLAQLHVRTTRRVEEGGALLRRPVLDRGGEHGHHLGAGIFHRSYSGKWAYKRKCPVSATNVPAPSVFFERDDVLVRAQRVKEPGAGEGPVPVGSAAGNPHCGGGLVQTGKET
jgi:hypothetical protein